MPKEQFREKVEPEKAIVERQKLELAMPTPANTPGKKAKSTAELNESMSPSQDRQQIEVPDVQAQAAQSQKVESPQRIGTRTQSC